MPADEPNESLLDVRDAATLLRVSTRTIWKLVAVKELPPPIRIGGARRWLKSDMHAYIRVVSERRQA